ncbi:non-catalytic member of peptidase subfamily M23B [Halioglobus japonicus]|uniref:M23ase beta-sheet core domain-containing protein n=1 Tax=Halioglobus japonicus TaxID=930805 RepID=A0AAP8MCQ0_9GAMM|nr:peptidoglycan DD-metalloendopeptidase family protein [Halioglobus japonicus]PLW85392.1 hypothetical protein C0029_12230 [Halioglobus japonicus]GHD15438.1 non-catalytic member of peptidase subfamily M23B [Halioglobus japonicus]
MKELKADISRINREISSANSRRNKLQSQLREAELEQARIQKALDGTQADIRKQEAQLDALRAEQQTLRSALDEQQSRIAVELRTAWQMGQQGQLKVLLNQESPDTVARVMGYYRYFFRARNELLEEYRQTLEQLAANEAKIDTTIATLEQRSSELTRQQERLVAAQATRQQAVNQLNTSIADKGTQLKKLEQDQQELQQLIDAIEKAVVNLEVPENYQAFKAARGKMPWPVSGRASHRFGNARNQGKMKWQGVKIPGKAGTEVKAIHHGRVVYADWLRGMGLLLIIDHGDGYMSLYAHNQTLLREVGEWVTAGTAISTLGDSGGLERPALYFEIRHNGKPTNPAKWCRR